MWQHRENLDIISYIWTCRIAEQILLPPPLAVQHKQVMSTNPVGYWPMSEYDASIFAQSIIDGKYLLRGVLRQDGFTHTVISTHGLVQTQVRCCTWCMKIGTNDANIVVCVCCCSHVSCHWIEVLLNVKTGFRNCWVRRKRREIDSLNVLDSCGR